MSEPQDAVGAGLAPARVARAIEPGERIHVIGSAGAGASAAGILAAAAGAVVSGCDLDTASPYVPALAAAGVDTIAGHDRAHVVSGDAVLVDRVAVTKALTAIDPNHPELEAAREAGIAVEAWQQVVADAAVSQGGRLIGIAGTHGKSTSAGWLVHLLDAAGRDPSAFVGALMAMTDGSPSTARWGRGDTFVVEADEYAGNFDPYRPSVAVVLNVEWDHPDVFADEEAVIDAFEAWLRASSAGARRIVNVSDRGGARLALRLADVSRSLVAVVDLDDPPGRQPEAARTVGYRYDGASLSLDGLETGPVQAPLRLPGRHNAANAACVAAAAAEAGVGAADIASGLASYAGVARRLQVKSEPGGVLIIDDYAHHPTAIRAAISAVRARYPDRRLWAAHEPLTYHRAAAMLDALAAALATADKVVIADIWAGRDRDTTVTSAAALTEVVRTVSDVEAFVGGDVEATADLLAGLVRRGDVVLAMGGGRSYVIADRLATLLTPERSE